MQDGKKKPLGISWESYAEQQIREAQAAGSFDNLPGFGKPIPGLDEPPDDWWWIRQKMHREKISLLPPGLQIRVDVEKELTRIWTLRTEPQVREAVSALNEFIRKTNLAIVWGPPSTTMPLDVAEVVCEWGAKKNSKA